MPFCIPGRTFLTMKVKGLIVTPNVQHNKYTSWKQIYIDTSFKERSKVKLWHHISVKKKKITLQQNLESN
jgi:hypothetical protein